MLCHSIERAQLKCLQDIIMVIYSDTQYFKLIWYIPRINKVGYNTGYAG